MGFVGPGSPKKPSSMLISTSKCVLWFVCQVRVGRLSFAVGFLQFARRQFLDRLWSILPVIIVVMAAVGIIITCLCCLWQRVLRQRSKLIPTRTEYNVNYVHVRDSSFQSDVSGHAVTPSPTGIHLPQTSKQFVITFVSALDFRQHLQKSLYVIVICLHGMTLRGLRFDVWLYIIDSGQVAMSTYICDEAVPFAVG